MALECVMPDGRGGMEPLSLLCALKDGILPIICRREMFYGCKCSKLFRRCGGFTEVLERRTFGVLIDESCDSLTDRAPWRYKLDAARTSLTGTPGEDDEQDGDDAGDHTMGVFTPAPPAARRRGRRCRRGRVVRVTRGIMVISRHQTADTLVCAD